MDSVILVSIFVRPKIGNRNGGKHVENMLKPLHIQTEQFGNVSGISIIFPCTCFFVQQSEISAHSKIADALVDVPGSCGLGKGIKLDGRTSNDVLEVVYSTANI